MMMALTVDVAERVVFVTVHAFGHYRRQHVLRFHMESDGSVGVAWRVSGQMDRVARGMPFAPTSLQLSTVAAPASEGYQLDWPFFVDDADIPLSEYSVMRGSGRSAVPSSVLAVQPPAPASALFAEVLSLLWCTVQPDPS